MVTNPNRFLVSGFWADVRNRHTPRLFRMGTDRSRSAFVGFDLDMAHLCLININPGILARP